MTEYEYFQNLEFRVCRELAGMQDDALRDWWCDGFVPDAFDVVGERCRITGRAWIGRDGQTCWQFVLYLGRARPRDQIDWALRELRSATEFSSYSVVPGTTPAPVCRQMVE